MRLQSFNAIWCSCLDLYSSLSFEIHFWSRSIQPLYHSKWITFKLLQFVIFAIFGMCSWAFALCNSFLLGFSIVLLTICNLLFLKPSFWDLSDDFEVTLPCQGILISFSFPISFSELVHLHTLDDLVCFAVLLIGNQFLF
jgi:hypothetical protein